MTEMGHTAWVVVVIPDGPMQLFVIGDVNGNPFPFQEAAELAADNYRHHGSPYSVYVTPVRKPEGP